MMKEEVIHYYNALTGKIPCGLDPKDTSRVKFSVFAHEVSCPLCLSRKPQSPRKKARTA